MKQPEDVKTEDLIDPDYIDIDIFYELLDAAKDLTENCGCHPYSDMAIIATAEATINQLWDKYYDQKERREDQMQQHNDRSCVCIPDQRGS